MDITFLHGRKLSDHGSGVKFACKLNIAKGDRVNANS